MTCVRWLAPCLLALSFLLGSCSRASEASSGSPKSVVRAFVDAVHADEKERALSFLTDAARSGLESGSGFRMESGRFADVELGAATIQGSKAELPLKSKEDGRVQEFVLLLKKVSGRWLIFGVRFNAGEAGELTIDFENVGSTMNALGEAMAAELKTAFEEAAVRSAERKRAERRAWFEALRPTTARELESRWKNTNDVRGVPAVDALRSIAGDLGLRVDPGGHADSLSAVVEVDVRGISRLEAIERIATQVGLYPRYPSGQEVMTRLQRGAGKTRRAGSQTRGAEEIDPLAITFAAGSRSLPVEFVGPYLMEVTQVEERVPHGTGTLTLTARSFGFDPGAFLLMRDYGEIIVIDKIVDHKDHSLKAKEDVRYHGAGLLVGGVYESTTHCNLRRLLREVESIDRVSGTQRLVLPVSVGEIEWENIEKGARKRYGDLSLEARSVGQHTSINIRGPESKVKNLFIAFRALDAEGEEIEVQWESTSQWRADAAQATLQATSTPASLRMKLVTARTVLEYPFDLRGIPLPRHGDQPERIEPLKFTGFPRPVDVEFVRFEDRDGTSPKIRLLARNHSNKDALSIHATLFYLGSDGETLNDFTQALMGRFDAQGHHPAATRGAEEEVEATAFFMPKQAVGVRVDIQSIEFVDGTTWERGD